LAQKKTKNFRKMRSKISILKEDIADKVTHKKKLGTVPF